MLVLSRKKNEAIVINADTTVTVVEIRGDKVRLGFTHPPGVSIYRQEVFDALLQSGFQNGAPQGSADPQLEIQRLKQELAAVRFQSKRYRELLQQYLQEEWRGVNREELSATLNETSFLDDTLSELEQGLPA